ncbi:MAG: hypothetical protein CVT65_04010 [Actinobacteria bacterium HGW-Actinobacteria-5]|nr:MAG: hypothetical protein CVT65_04010 [Actinobacteria bacterium HGW-Actinobacteria-5]
MALAGRHELVPLTGEKPRAWACGIGNPKYLRWRECRQFDYSMVQIKRFGDRRRKDANRLRPEDDEHPTGNRRRWWQLFQ